MSFIQFLKEIFTYFTTVFNNFINYFNIILNNNYIKFIIYLITFGFMIRIFFNIYKIFMSIFDKIENSKENMKKKDKEIE